jgi:hypothetical protein
MEPRLAEMRSDRRAELQRGAQKRFLQRLAVFGVIAGPARGIVIQQGLMFFPSVVVFGREDFAVTGGLPVGVTLFLQQDAESITRRGSV